MRKSESINELVTALTKAQANLRGVHKDAKNPHFKSDYSSLAAVTDAVRPVLAAEGLALVQGTEQREDGTYLSTLLAHTSGQWLESDARLNPVKADPQGFGSAITYWRRYQALAICGIAPVDDDDDGHAASTPRNPPQPQRIPPSVQKPVQKPAASQELRARVGKAEAEYPWQHDKHRANKRAQIAQQWAAETGNPIPQQMTAWPEDLLQVYAEHLDARAAEKAKEAKADPKAETAYEAPEDLQKGVNALWGEETLLDKQDRAMGLIKQLAEAGISKVALDAIVATTRGIKDHNKLDNHIGDLETMLGDAKNIGKAA